jgi:hypothetical protein
MFCNVNIVYETLKFETLKIILRNLNEIVCSWIRLSAGEGGGARPSPFTLQYLPSLTKLQCTVCSSWEGSYNSARSAENSAQSTENSAQSAENSAQSTENSAQSAENSARSAENSAQSAENLAQSAKNSVPSAENPAQSAVNTAQAAENSAQSAENSVQSAVNSAQSAENSAQTAKNSVKSDENSAQSAVNSAQAAETQLSLQKTLKNGKMCRCVSRIKLPEKMNIALFYVKPFFIGAEKAKLFITLFYSCSSCYLF